MRIARKLLPQGIVPKPLNKNKGPVLTILRNQSQLHPTSIGSTEESAFCKKGTASVSCEACSSNVIRLAQVESLSIKNGHLSGLHYIIPIAPVPSATGNTVVKRFNVLAGALGMRMLLASCCCPPTAPSGTVTEMTIQNSEKRSTCGFCMIALLIKAGMLKSRAVQTGVWFPCIYEARILRKKLHPLNNMEQRNRNCFNEIIFG